MSEQDKLLHALDCLQSDMNRLQEARQVQQIDQATFVEQIKNLSTEVASLTKLIKEGDGERSILSRLYFLEREVERLAREFSEDSKELQVVLVRLEDRIIATVKRFEDRLEKREHDLDAKIDSKVSDRIEIRVNALRTALVSTIEPSLERSDIIDLRKTELELKREDSQARWIFWSKVLAILGGALAWLMS